MSNTHPQPPSQRPPNRRPSKTWSRQDALHQADGWIALNDPNNHPAASVALANAHTLTLEARAAHDAGNPDTAAHYTAQAEHTLRTAETKQPVPRYTIKEVDGGLTQLNPPEPPDWAAWLYRTPTGLTNEALESLLTTRQQKVITQLELTVHTHWQANRRIADARARNHAHEQAARLATLTRQLLQAALETGLRERLDQRRRLTYRERLLTDYLQVAGISLPNLHVCCDCAAVFEGIQHAQRCEDCRKHPIRTTLKEWHVSLNPTPRATSFKHPHPYQARCQECGTEFPANDARKKYCPQHATPAARTARHRRTKKRDPAQRPGTVTTRARRHVPKSRNPPTGTVAKPSRKAPLSRQSPCT